MPTQEFELQTEVGAIKGVAPEGVMPPSPYSLLLANNIPHLDNRGTTFLDLGTGTGILAIVAALKGGKMILASDNNPEALEAAAYNARINGVGNSVKVLPPGEMFEPLGNVRVDGIFCNPAQLPMAPNPNLPGAYSAGERGRNMVEDLILSGGNHLNKGGGLLFTSTSLIHPFKTFQALWDKGFICEVRAQMDLAFRDFYDTDWIEKVYGDWMNETFTKFPNLPFLNLQERLILEKEGLFKKEHGTYFEKVSVLHTAKPEYEIGTDENGNKVVIEKPNFLHPNPKR